MYEKQVVAGFLIFQIQDLGCAPERIIDSFKPQNLG